MKTNPERDKIANAVWDAFMFEGADYKEIDIEYLALLITEKNNDFLQYPPDVLKDKLAKYLYSETTHVVKGKRVEDKTSKYQRVKGKKIVYKLRKQKKKIEKPMVKPIPKEETSTDNASFIGKAGEMAVCSELLFNEYRAATMPFDDGIDIVALKNGKTFYVQVKTTQITKEGNFSFKIKTASFERYDRNDCFYIFVARGKENTFIVTTAHDISRWIKSEMISRNERNITITVSQMAGHLFVKDEDLTPLINAFDILK